MQKLKVCLFCRHFYPHVGGNETQTMNLALELIKCGVDVMIVTARIDQSYLTYELYNNIHIYRVRYYSLYRFLANRLNLRQKVTVDSSLTEKSINEKKKTWLRKVFVNINYLIEEYSFMRNSIRIMSYNQNKFDLIHSQILLNYGYMALVAGLKLRKPVLIKDASLGGLDKITLKPNIKKKCELLREKAYFIAISSKIKENLIQQGIPENNIFNIPNGIDIENINSKKRNNVVPYTILYVGNFWQGDIKGLDILINALGEVVKKYPQAKLFVAGDGNISYYKAIAKECHCESSIKFLGQVKNMDNLYRTCSIFVLPSRQEGMSNATLEAMSYGMPCIVTDVSGSSDQIDDGKDGIIVPIGDSNSISKSICYLLGNPEISQIMGEAAKEKIRNKFDMSKVTLRMIDVYKQITYSVL